MNNLLTCPECNKQFAPCLLDLDSTGFFEEKCVDCSIKSIVDLMVSVEKQSTPEKTEEQKEHRKTADACYTALDNVAPSPQEAS